MGCNFKCNRTAEPDAEQRAVIGKILKFTTVFPVQAPTESSERNIQILYDDFAFHAA
jgi:hypothetical protein